MMSGRPVVTDAESLRRSERKAGQLTARLDWYTLTWVITDAERHLRNHDDLVSSPQEFTDDEADRYEFTVSLELNHFHHFEGQDIKVCVDVAGLKLRKRSACMMIWAYIDGTEAAAAGPFGNRDRMTTIRKATKFIGGRYGLDDVLDKSKRMIVNDTLTVVVKMAVKGEEVTNMTDQAAAPTETAFAKMFHDDSFSDVVLLSSDRRQFRAHKCVLAVRSPVFRAMFLSELKETTESEVDIADCSAEVVEQMLAFMYMGATPTAADDLLFDLLKAADKYDVQDLVVVCGDKIAQLINADNAAELLMMADTYGATNLKESAIDWAAGHINDVMKGPGWNRLCDTLPRLAGEVLKQAAKLM